MALNPTRILAGLAILAGVSGAALWFVTNGTQPAAQAQQQYQTAVVRQGDLLSYASGSGTLVAGEQVELGFGSPGSVAAVYAQPGEQVQAGQVLAEQADVEGLQAELAQAELALYQAQQALDTLIESADLSTAQAMVALAEARQELEDAQSDWQAQQAGHRASSTTIKAAEAELALAEDERERAKAAYDSCGSSDDPECAQLYKNFAAAEQRYWRALANLNWYTGQPTETQQLQLDAQLALAEAQLNQAQRDYDRVAGGPNPYEVGLAELKVSAAEAALASAQRDLEMAVITAPFAGTIMEVGAAAGDEVAGSFITLADLSVAQLEISLDETDANMVSVGLSVEVVFDTYPDRVYAGVVVQVDPRLSTDFGISTVEALVQLDGASFEGLLLGMNASVDVISGRAEGVALVPVEALRELGPGEYAVLVLEDGQPRLRQVEVGLMDLTFAEIVSGLEIGEVVTTGVVETG